MCVSVCACFYLLLYVLQQKGGGSQIVHWDVEEALDLFLMEVHGDQVGETCTNMVSSKVSMLQFNKMCCFTALHVIHLSYVQTLKYCNL